MERLHTTLAPRIAPQFGHIPVDEVSRASVQQFVDTLTVGPWAKVSTLRLLRSILDVAREDGRIHRNPAHGLSAGRIIVGPPKTRAAKRTVPLPQIVIDVLTPRIAGRQPDQPAVASPNGALLRSNNWRRHAHWTEALRTTKLAPLTIHDLRHTYASLARKSGADLRYVQKTMGHSTPTVTANIYSDLYADELDQVATNLDRLQTGDSTNNNGQEPDTPNQP